MKIMQHIQQVWRGMSSLAWSQRLCRCAQASDAQALKEQAIYINSRHKSTNWCESSEAVDGAISMHINKVQSTGHLKVLSTKSATSDSSKSAELVDVIQRSTCVESVQCFLSTPRSTVHQPIPSANLRRQFSTTCTLRRDDSPLNEHMSNQQAESTTQMHTILNQQPTDQQLKSDTNMSTGCSESPLEESVSPSTGGRPRSPTPQPPDPDTCCESGCVNCVWIRYVQELQEHGPDNKEEVRKVLDLIEDYNVKMFVKMEMGL